MIQSIDVRFDRANGALVVRLRGEVDLSNAAMIKRSIEDSVSNRELKVVVDLERVVYLDSAGIGILFALRRHLGTRSQGLVLLVPDGSPLRRSLEVSGWPGSAIESKVDRAIAIEP